MPLLADGSLHLADERTHLVVPGPRVGTCVECLLPNFVAAAQPLNPLCFLASKPLPFFAAALPFHPYGALVGSFDSGYHVSQPLLDLHASAIGPRGPGLPPVTVRQVETAPAVTDVVVPRRPGLLPLRPASRFLLSVFVRTPLRYLTEHDLHRRMPVFKREQRLARIEQVSAAAIIGSRRASTGVTVQPRASASATREWATRTQRLRRGIRSRDANP